MENDDEQKELLRSRIRAFPRGEQQLTQKPHAHPLAVGLEVYTPVIEVAGKVSLHWYRRDNSENAPATQEHCNTFFGSLLVSCMQQGTDANAAVATSPPPVTVPAAPVHVPATMRSRMVLDEALSLVSPEETPAASPDPSLRAEDQVCLFPSLRAMFMNTRMLLPNRSIYIVYIFIRLGAGPAR